jgi:hypothetical protein
VKATLERFFGAVPMLKKAVASPTGFEPSVNLVSPHVPSGLSFVMERSAVCE